MRRIEARPLGSGKSGWTTSVARRKTPPYSDGTLAPVPHRRNVRPGGSERHPRTRRSQEGRRIEQGDRIRTLPPAFGSHREGTEPAQWSAPRREGGRRIGPRRLVARTRRSSEGDAGSLERCRSCWTKSGPSLVAAHQSQSEQQRDRAKHLLAALRRASRLAADKMTQSSGNPVAPPTARSSVA